MGITQVEEGFGVKERIVPAQSGGGGGVLGLLLGCSVGLRVALRTFGDGADELCELGAEAFLSQHGLPWAGLYLKRVRNTPPTSV